jgi:hypothetical protein
MRVNIHHCCFDQVIAQSVQRDSIVSAIFFGTVGKEEAQRIYRVEFLLVRKENSINRVLPIPKVIGGCKLVADARRRSLEIQRN